LLRVVINRRRTLLVEAVTMDLAEVVLAEEATEILAVVDPDVDRIAISAALLQEDLVSNLRVVDLIRNPIRQDLTPSLTRVVATAQLLGRRIPAGNQDRIIEMIGRRLRTHKMRNILRAVDLLKVGGTLIGNQTVVVRIIVGLSKVARHPAQEPLVRNQQFKKSQGF
jgi:hypothetical protein